MSLRMTSIDIKRILAKAILDTRGIFSSVARKTSGTQGKLRRSVWENLDLGRVLKEITASGL